MNDEVVRICKEAAFAYSDPQNPQLARLDKELSFGPPKFVHSVTTTPTH